MAVFDVLVLAVGRAEQSSDRLIVGFADHIRVGAGVLRQRDHASFDQECHCGGNSPGAGDAHRGRTELGVGQEGGRDGARPPG